jgi:hypothetical protein
MLSPGNRIVPSFLFVRYLRYDGRWDGSPIAWELSPDSAHRVRRIITISNG